MYSDIHAFHFWNALLIADAETAAAALEHSGNADAATLATLREAPRVLAEAPRSLCKLQS